MPSALDACMQHTTWSPLPQPWSAVPPAAHPALHTLCSPYQLGPLVRPPRHGVVQPLLQPLDLCSSVLSGAPCVERFRSRQLELQGDDALELSPLRVSAQASHNQG
jgi:hypothetical protein